MAVLLSELINYLISVKEQCGDLDVYCEGYPVDDFDDDIEVDMQKGGINIGIAPW